MNEGKFDLITSSYDFAEKVHKDNGRRLDADRQYFTHEEHIRGGLITLMIFWGLDKSIVEYLDYIEPELSVNDDYDLRVSGKRRGIVRMRRKGKVINSKKEIKLKKFLNLIQI